MSRGRADDRIREAVDAGLAAVAEGMGLDPSPRSLAPAVRHALRLGVSGLMVSSGMDGEGGFRSDPEDSTFPWEWRIDPDHPALLDVRGGVKLDRLRELATASGRLSDIDPDGFARLVAEVGALVPRDGTSYPSRAMMEALSELPEDEWGEAARLASVLDIGPPGRGDNVRHAPRELLDELPPLGMTYETAGGPVSSRLVLRIVSGCNATYVATPATHRSHAGVLIVAILVFDGPAPRGWSREERRGFWDAWNRRVGPDPPTESTGGDDPNAGGKGLPLFAIASTTALVDRDTEDAVDLVGRLPRHASAAPRIEDAIETERKRLVEWAGGERAAIEKARANARNGDYPLAVAENGVALSRDRERSFRRTLASLEGYRETEPGGRSERYVIGCENGKGRYIEASLSLGGMVDALDPEGRERLRRENEEQLFPSMAATDIQAMEDAARFFPHLVLQMVRSTHVIVPLPELRMTFFQGKGGRRRAERMFAALRSFKLRVELEGDRVGTLETSAVLEWEYLGAGPGRHTDGVFTVHMSKAFLGVLADMYAIREGVSRLHGRAKVEVLDAIPNAKPPAKGNAGRGYAKRKTLAEIYPIVLELSDEATKLNRWLESGVITRRGDGARSEFPGWPERGGVIDGDRFAPRLYTSEFCPLIPKGQEYQGALGTWSENPEAGWTLAGKRRSGKPAGTRSRGLIDEMGLTLRGVTGAAARAKLHEKAIGVLRELIFDCYGGVVAGLAGREWISLAEIETLTPTELEGVRLYLFLPDDWDRRGDRAISDRYGVRITNDHAEAEGEIDKRLGDGFMGDEIKGAIRAAGTTQEGMAEALGVGLSSVKQWCCNGKKVPKKHRAKVERFIADAGRREGDDGGAE